MHIPRPFVHKRNVLCNETDTFKALKNRTSCSIIVPKSGNNNALREVFMMPRCGGDITYAVAEYYKYCGCRKYISRLNIIYNV